MDATQVRTLLEADQDATRSRMAALTADLDAVAAATAGSNLDDEHDPEGSTVAFEREQLAASRDQAKHHLDEVADALARLDSGGYGTCEVCGADIGAARLDALPTTRWCIGCAATHRR